jgi:hypothetical protein
MDSAGSIRDAVNHAVGLHDRARSPRSVEDIEPTLLSLSLELRQGNAFTNQGRTRPVDLRGQLLAMPISRVLDLGKARLRKFVTERYLDKTVPLRARLEAADSGRIAISVAENVPEATKPKPRRRSRSRRPSKPRGRSRSASASASDDEYMSSGSSDAPMSASASDSDSRSASRSPRPRSRERQQGFLAAVRMQSEPD